MTPISRSPARLSRGISIGTGIVALGLSGLYSWPALGVGSLGLVFLGVGLARGAHAGVSLGAFGLFVAAVLAGISNAPVGTTLASVALSVLAWDVGGNAISVGAQLGRDADTRRAEVVHAAGSGVVGLVTAVVGYGLYQAGTGGQPIAALVFALIAAVLLVEALG